MKTLKQIAIVILLCIAFFSCEQESLTLQKEPYKDLDEFYAKNGAPIQLFSIKAESGGSITGTRGTVIALPPNAFQDAAGNLVTGTVTVTLREVYNKADMVLSNVSTMCNGRPLVSGGMFELLAWRGNEQLKMADGKYYTATLPSSAPDNSMLPYVGLDSSKTTNWLQVDSSSSTDSAYLGFDFLLYTNASSYVLTSNWLGWYNCDHPFTQGLIEEIHFNSPEDLSKYYVDAFLLFEDNVGLHLGSFYAGSFLYSYAPDGYKGTAVFLGLKDSALYSAFVPFTVSSGAQIEYTLKQTTTDEFEASLDSLK